MGNGLVMAAVDAVVRARQRGRRCTSPPKYPHAEHLSAEATVVIYVMASGALDKDGYDAWASHPWPVYARALGRPGDPQTGKHGEADRRAVTRAIHDLIDFGLIETIERGRPGRTARYRLALGVSDPTTWEAVRPASSTPNVAPEPTAVRRGMDATWDAAHPQQGTPHVPPREVKGEEGTSAVEVVNGDAAPEPADPDGHRARAFADWARYSS